VNWLQEIWHRGFRRPYKLAYIEYGTGPNTVVLLHGIATSKEVWTGVIKDLSPKEWRVIAPDLLGFGDSPNPQWNTYSVQEHARMVLALLKRLKVRGPVVLVGYSMGCLVAAHIATINRKLASGLVLYEPPLLGEVPEFPGYSKNSARYKALFEFIISKPDYVQLDNEVLWGMVRKFYGIQISRQHWLAVERSLRNTILSQQAYRQLKDIKVPTEIIYGRLDMLVIRRGIKDMFASNPDVNFHLVNDVHGISTSSAKFIGKLIRLKAKVVSYN
jgi:pimeloyl-ACP methyl ester carboxylesterase